VKAGGLQALNGVGEFDRGTSKFSRDRLDAEVRELMRRQFGNVSRRQLLALGYSSGRVQARLRNGTLVKRHDGVYCQAPARQDPQALIAAAEAFEADRERDTDNLDHALSTVRITKKRLTNTPDDEAARLRRILTRGERRR
jgi:hypothetical protein